MPYVYHKKPKNMFGNILYPLNSLKHINQDLYKEESSKYKGREERIKNVIPILNCLWNDVIHLSTINPRLINKALVNSGHKVTDAQFFKIDISQIAQFPAVFFKYIHDVWELLPDEFELLDIDKYAELKEVPIKTINHYRWCAENNKRPFLHHGIPHVLVKGEIDISNAKVVTWADNNLN